MPVVGEVARRCSREGVLRGARGRVPRGVLGGPASALKVAGVPEEDPRQHGLLRVVEREALRLVPEPELELGRELVVEAVVAAIGLAEQIRAGPRGAVDAGVDARLVPARADDAVLDLVIGFASFASVRFVIDPATFFSR